MVHRRRRGSIVRDCPRHRRVTLVDGLLLHVVVGFLEPLELATVLQEVTRPLSAIVICVDMDVVGTRQHLGG
jgi:hypothetical protein